jgi:molecular chaperone IbpA
MRTIDFSPLFRSTVGFDRMQRLLDGALRLEDQSVSYPPYNIEARGEDAYRITMAVAGFGENELDLTVKENRLVVSGKAKEPEEGVVMLHRGIAGRSFERWFDLADNIKVVGAELSNGLLRIDLARQVPEEQKPRKIAIGNAPVIEGKKAA